MTTTKCLLTIKNKFTCIIVSAVLFAGCAISDNEVDPEKGFTRVYNDESFENTYSPIDMAQMADSGYLILGQYDLNKIYLLRTDHQGNFEWDLQLEENFVNSIPGIIRQDSANYFYCMDELTLETYLMQIDDINRTTSVVNTYSEIIYPLHASQTDDGGILLLSYERNSLSSKLTKLNSSFQESWHKEYEVIEDVEQDIIAHVSGIGERLPFFTGTADGKFFFNGYSNYSFSLHFIDKTNGEQTGVINGFRDSGAISAAININGNDYALTRYSFGDNYILSKNSLNENEVAFSSDLSGSPHPEIEKDAFVNMNRITINDKEIISVASTTKSGQIILYLFNAQSGALMGSKRLGFTNPYSAVKVIQTHDNGVAILGNTFITGRFSRICLFKIPEERLIDLTSE